MQKLLPFEDFLTYLQQQGFALGVDDFLQIQTLLNRLPKDCPPEKLKSLMCPLLASNEEEQEYFYRAFDRYFDNLKLQFADLQEVAPPSSAPLEQADEELKQYQKHGEKLEWSFKGFFYQQFQTIVVSVVILLLLLGGGFVYFNVLQEETPKRVSIEETDDYDTQFDEYENYVFEEKDSTIESEKPTSTSKKDNFQKSKKEGIGFIEFLCWMLLIFAVWMFMLHFKVRREFYLETLENIEPPHYWNIQVPKSELNLARSQAFKHAANRLQKRCLIPTQKVNIAETVEATVAAAGFPDFKYLQKSAMPEYLLLIDQSSTKDQQTRWFEMWFEALKEREVMVHRFFFHGNPEWCWDAEQHYVSLAELYHRFGECRLVVIADDSIHRTALGHPPNPLQRGNQNSPFEGGRGDVSIFSDWQEKTLLSTTRLPKSTAQYLEEESGFVVLPARMESLNQLSDIFEGEGSIAPKVSTYATSINTDLEKLKVSEQVAELKRMLTDVGFDCLCAAAMYPEMNWDLTVFLAETLYDERDLLKEENILPLVSLPYFRKGFMREELRRALMAELDEDGKRLVKEAILHLLKLHPLVDDEYSAEFFDYQLHIALQDAQLHPQDEYKLSTLKHLVEQQQFEESRYKQVVLRFLEAREEGFSLGRTFGKWFKKEDEIVGVEKVAIEEKPSVEKRTVQKKSKSIYVYPKANAIVRLWTTIENVFFTLLISVVLTAFLKQVSITTTLSFQVWLGTLSFQIWLGLAGLIFVIFRTGNKASHFVSQIKTLDNEQSYRLLIIDINSNTPTKRWKKIFRRSLYLLFLFLVYYFFYLNLNLKLEVFLTLVFSWNIVRWIWSKSGRTVVDFLMGTQVVNYSDFLIKNYTVKHLSDSYVYPKADAGNRVEAISMESTLVLFGLFVTSIFLYFIGINIYLILRICFLLAIFLWLLLESMNDPTLGKPSSHLMIVDLKTNQKARLWKRLGRRIVDFSLLTIFWGIAYFFNLNTIYYLSILSAYIIVNFVLILIRKGRRLGDYLFGTQVINVSDFTGQPSPTPTNKETQPSAKHIFIYPKANKIKQNSSVFSGETALITICLVMIPIISLLLEFTSIPWKLIAAIAAFIVWIVWSTMDIWNQETNPDGSPKHLMIVDVKTNQPAKTWKILARRNVVFGLLAFCGGLVYWGGYGMLFILVPIVLIQLMSSFLNNSARGLADSFLGTQLINVSDFEAKNYDILNKKDNRKEQA